MTSACFVSPISLQSRRSPRRRLHLTSRRPIFASQAGVLGATGGLGRIIVERLLDSTRSSSSSITSVSAFARNLEKAADCLPADDPALVLKTLPSSEDSQALRDAFRGISYLIVCVGTTAFPSKSWRNGNTPTAIDDIAVSRWMEALDEQSIRRIVYISSIGVRRSSSFPFFILNAFGVLDAKRRGESHVIEAARRFSCAYAILRPGRLVGGPYTNVGAMNKEPNPRKQGVRFARGDCVSGDMSRSITAEIAAISTTWDNAKDLDMCFVHTEGEALGQEQLREKMKVCELSRIENTPQS